MNYYYFFLLIKFKLIVKKNFIAWHELILADIAYRSTATKLLLWPERVMERNDAEILGYRIIFDRIINELTVRFKDLEIDRMEIAALRCAILYNPGNLKFKKNFFFRKSN